MSDVDRIQAEAARLVAELTVEELEEVIAPIDCAKKPNHPDCPGYHKLDGGGPGPNPEVP